MDPRPPTKGKTVSEQRRGLKPGQYHNTPRPSSSSSADSEAISSESVSPPQSTSSEPTGQPGIPNPQIAQQITTVMTATTSALSIEECSDFDDSDDDRLDVIRPHAIEDAESERSRSRSQNRPELDPRVVYGLQGLNCDTESDADDIDQDEFQEVIRRARAERQRRRYSSSWINKRTISESIGSDSDREDLQDVLETSKGSLSTRRLRARRQPGSNNIQPSTHAPTPRISLDTIHSVDSEDATWPDTQTESIFKGAHPDPPPSQQRTFSAPESLSSDEFISLVRETLSAAIKIEEQEKSSKKQPSEITPGVSMDFSRKNIRHLPEQFIDITKDYVERLALNHNEIQTLPARFSELKVLRYLNIRNNELKTIPTTVFEMRTLEILDIGGNRLQELPDAIANMTSLKVLACQNNQIRILPSSLARIEMLRLIKFDDNPIIYPPAEFLEQLKADVSYRLHEDRPDRELGDMEVEMTFGIKKYLRQQILLSEQPMSPNDIDDQDPLRPFAANPSDSPHFSQVPQAEKKATTDTGSLPGGAPTDSGYATGRYDASTQLQPSESGPAEGYGIGPGQDIEPDDSATIYSDSSSLPQAEQEDYILDLAVELLRQVQTNSPDEEVLTRISTALPELLKCFALKLGYNASSQLQRDVMFFIHKNRRKISCAFDKQRHLEKDLDEEITSTPDVSIDKVMSPKDKMQFWYDHFENPETELPEVSFALDESSEEDSDGTMELRVYRNFILKSSAYEWLRATLQREVALDLLQAQAFNSIKETITSTLRRTQKISRRVAPAGSSARFVVDWDPLQFLEQQSYTESNENVLEKVITLTSTINDPQQNVTDVQALTCRQYLRQTWPATSDYLLDALRKLVSIASDEQILEPEVQGQYHPPDWSGDQTIIVDVLFVVDVPDGSRITSSMQKLTTGVTVSVSGPAEFVVEVGQQLAWIGAALRPSRHSSGICICFPRINVMPGSAIQIAFNISYTEYILPWSEKYPNGQCWRNMFRSPVLVAGYPIRRKLQSPVGIEIPLNIMAALSGTNWINEFNNTIFIKGFSSMLVAVKQASDFIIWHYLYNKAGEHISYLDFDGKAEHSISISILDRTRHIVGWCTDSEYYAGAADAKLDIERSRLPPPYPGCLLEKVSISAGKIVSAGASFAIGMRDLPIHVSRQGYIPKLKWIAQKFLVFWDEQDKRGWLVNGTSALLHIVRASLEHDRTDDFASSYLFDPNKIKNTKTTHKPNSAIPILIDIDNMEIEIYPEKEERYGEETTRLGSAPDGVFKKNSTFYRFQDRVEHHYNNLEQMIDHQARAAGQNGINMKVRIRKHLEGWEFVDLISDCDLRPRVATLHAYGYGWVDFVRSIQAPVLFGRGFGDIIKPVNTGFCEEWSSVPKGRYYLTTSVWDLRRVIEMYGDIRARPLRICHELVWCCPEELFDACRCHRRSVKGFIQRKTRKHHNPVQGLFPTTFRHAMPASSRFDPKDHEDGAVIWGHSINMSVSWGETGDPEEGSPPTPPKNTGDSTIDSGIGSSLTSSLLEDALPSDLIFSPTNNDLTHVSLPLRPRRDRSDQYLPVHSAPEDRAPSATSSGAASGEHHRNLRREKRRLR